MQFDVVDAVVGALRRVGHRIPRCEVKVSGVEVHRTLSGCPMIRRCFAARRDRHTRRRRARHRRRAGDSPRPLPRVHRRRHGILGPVYQAHGGEHRRRPPQSVPLSGLRREAAENRSVAQGAWRALRRRRRPVSWVADDRRSRSATRRRITTKASASSPTGTDCSRATATGSRASTTRPISRARRRRRNWGS